MQELHQYGRQLLRNKKNKEALEVFELNAKNHPGEFTPLMGLTRGYSANGEYAKAAATAKKALVLAPDKTNKDAIARFITMLESGKDINQ
jgi:Flp pilus assembly protein TadD